MLIHNFDADIAVPYVIAVVLNCDVAAILSFVNHQAICTWEFATFAEFAVVKHFFPLRGPKVIFQNFFAILVVDDSTFKYNNLSSIPLAIFLGILRFCGNHVIQRCRLAVAVYTQFCVNVVVVVQYLIF